MNTKLFVLLALASMLLCTSSGFSQPYEEEAVPQDVSKNNDLIYDTTLYGTFWSLIYVYDMDFSASEYSIRKGEEISFSVSFFINESLLDDRFSNRMGIEEPVRDIDVKFILTNYYDKWSPTFQTEKDNIPWRGLESAEDMGRAYRPLTKRLHGWYDSLKDSTDNIYSLDIGELYLSQEANYTETTATISIDQGGRWYLTPLIKPSQGDYWIPGPGVLIRVERPDGIIYWSMPIIASLLIATPTIFVTWKCNKKRG